MAIIVKYLKGIMKVWKGEMNRLSVSKLIFAASTQENKETMKISYNWLRQYLSIDLEATTVARLLTDCGLEVEAMEPFQSLKGGLEGIVIGEVKTCVKHPNADKLSITTVDIGAELPLHIVCGAPNVAAGQKVVVAMVGARLYPAAGEPFEIKKSKIRGELSEGMICAEDEIGIGSSHDGIIILPPDTKAGTSGKAYFNVEEDTIFEIGLTPNRADAASHIGVARDLAALLRDTKSAGYNGGEKPQLQYPATDHFKAERSDYKIEVEVKDIVACPRYSGLTMTGVSVNESPKWLQHKLLAIGVHPINNIVDITNYVLHECGQPLHAFDADEIKGKKIIVRKATAGEKFVTLDGVERQLSASDLMICDTNDAMCIAGVFGGIHSGISDKTKNIFIESAYFNPASIRKSSKQHGLKTDASFRFERGADPEITLYALKRAAMLIQEVAGGKPAGEIVDIYPEKIQPKEVEYNFSRANALIGKAIEKAELKNILSSLNITIEKETSDSFLLTIPTYKVDVTREADVVEEVLRIYGYNNVEVPPKLSAALSYFPKVDAEELQDRISGYLTSNGFFEMMNNSLAKRNYPELSENSEETAVTIINPLSQELSLLRQTMLYSGLETIEYNRNRQHSDLKFFEFGTTYLNTDRGYSEQHHLSVFVTGKQQDESWTGARADVNFFYLKTFALQVLQLSGIDISKLKDSTAAGIYSYGITWKLNENPLLTVGSVSKKNLKPFGITAEVFYADFNWRLLLKGAAANKIRYSEVPKFPQVKRDLSLIIGSGVSYQQIRDIAFRTEKNLLRDVNLFDVYEGDKIEAGKKSYAVSFILLDERQTLTDKTIEKVMNRIMEALEKEAGAIIRK